MTSLLFRTNGEKTSSAAFPVQLTPRASKWCARKCGCIGWAAASPELHSLPLLHRHTHTHFLLGDMGASAFCQGVFSCRSLGPLTWWESGLLTPQPTSPSSSLQMRRKTRPEESTAAHPLQSSPVFSLLSQYFALVPFTSSLSSVIDNVNWLTESVVHWLWSLIKGLLIGTLFNTGPCNESCPLMLSWQQPFPVCQSFNVINYVTQLRRLFFSHISFVA